jgi:hypothetical protein
MLCLGFWDIWSSEAGVLLGAATCRCAQDYCIVVTIDVVNGGTAIRKLLSQHRARVGECGRTEYSMCTIKQTQSAAQMLEQ